MHFGIFLEERRRGVSESATLRETIDLVDVAEAQGLDGVWLGEIHFNGTRSIQSAPLPFASFLAARSPAPTSASKTHRVAPPSAKEKYDCLTEYGTQVLCLLSAEHGCVCKRSRCSSQLCRLHRQR